MANILELLRGVLTEVEVRRAFDADPAGFLQRTGFGDLTGEDVAEAIAVVRRSLPPEVAAALAAFEDEDELTGVRPRPGERELDAAARVLRGAADLVPLRRAPAAPAAEPPAPGPAAAAPPSPPEAAPPGLPDAASIAAFGDTITTILGETKARLTDVLRQAAQDAEQIRAEAAADREAAREYLERTRAEADEALARSRAVLEDAERQREELLEATRVETDAARREIEARRSELRDAERQLRERLAGIETLFRTVLRDDPAEAG